MANPPITRRSYLAMSIAAATAVPAFAQTASDLIVETQSGDPQLPGEQISFSESLMARLTSTQRAVLAPRIEDFSTRFLTAAQEFLGFNRQDNEPEITEMLGTFGLGFRQGDPPAFVPYCAAGASYVAGLVYARQAGEDLTVDRVIKVRKFLPEVTKFHFQPSVSVIDIWKVGDGTRRMIPRNRLDGVKPGWLIVFDWRRTGLYERADHIGLVESVDLANNTVTTIEFNTATTGANGSAQRNGGHVARRVRPVDPSIKGFIDTNKRYLA